MSFIIMGRDECNDEFRPDFPEYETEDEAYQHIGEARERYPEARSIWVELYRDSNYYRDLYANMSPEEMDYYMDMEDRQNDWY